MTRTRRAASAEDHAESGAGHRILVVEDESLFASAVARHLGQSGFHCELAGTLADARTALGRQRPDLILLDMRLPDGTGLDFLRRLQESETADVPVVVLTAFGHLDDAVDAMKLNAVDYLKKPIDLDELEFALRKVLDTARVARKLDYSRQRETRARESHDLLGTSVPMVQVREQLERIGRLSGAGEEAAPTVLILGETGTGKDLAARFLHHRSTRRNRPFVQVDCATLPRELVESELFGHEKGAFTGAQSARTGLIEAAEEGTLFLDEIAELPLDLQPKLLAVLERRSVRRVGSSRERPIEAWFVAATNRPLEQLVAEGQFRADLYYRLKVLTIGMPRLRERGEDVALLAQHYVTATARRFGLPAPALGPAFLDALSRYDWPGNVRELANVVERAVLLSGGQALEAGSLALGAGAPAQPAHAVEALEQLPLPAVEKLLIERALARCGGNVSQAARELGISRMALRHRIKHYEIDVRGG